MVEHLAKRKTGVHVSVNNTLLYTLLLLHNVFCTVDFLGRLSWLVVLSYSINIQFYI